MPVTIVKSKGTPGGFDPTPKKGWDTFLVKKDGTNAVLVLGYAPGKMMKLRSRSGKVFMLLLKPGVFEMVAEQYEVRLVSKA